MKKDAMTARLALTIVALGAGIACATSQGASSLNSATNPTNAEIDAAETDVPASVDFPNRPIDEHSPTAAEIEAAERGNPNDIGYDDRPAASSDAPSKAGGRQGSGAGADGRARDADDAVWESDKDCCP